MADGISVAAARGESAQLWPCPVPGRSAAGTRSVLVGRTAPTHRSCQPRAGRGLLSPHVTPNPPVTSSPTLRMRRRRSGTGRMLAVPVSPPLLPALSGSPGTRRSGRVRRLTPGLHGSGNTLLLCPITTANEELGGTQWRRKIPSAARQDSGGTAALGTRSCAPPSRSSLCRCAGGSAGGNRLRGAGTRGGLTWEQKAADARFLLDASLPVLLRSAEEPVLPVPPVGSDPPSGSSAEKSVGDNSVNTAG